MKDSDDVALLVKRLKTAHRDAAPSDEDLASVEHLSDILEWQEYMVRLWEDGFRSALATGDVSGNEEYRNLQEEMERIEPLYDKFNPPDSWRLSRRRG